MRSARTWRCTEGTSPAPRPPSPRGRPSWPSAGRSCAAPTGCCGPAPACSERQEDEPAAAALLGAVWDGHAARGIVAERCLLGSDLVRLARGVGDHDRVAAVVVGVDEAARRAQCGSARGAALRTAALASADPALATAAVAAYDSLGRRLEQALAREDAARLLADSGDPGAARELLDDALTAYDACGAAHDARRAAATLRALGVRRGARGPGAVPRWGGQP